MRFLIATHNKSKIKEFSRILSPLGISVINADDIGLVLTEVEETGENFSQNAYLKAKSGCDESGLPCIADDSGLCVDALGGEPGIYSARYAGEHGNDKLNIEKLLKKLENIPDGERTARFVCCVCCVFPNGDVIESIGECEGKIAYAPKGSGGFGYDPVFLYGKKTFAELTDEEKDSVSHRGKALRRFFEKTAEYFTSERNEFSENHG